MKPKDKHEKKQCIHCEQYFFDRSMNNDREYCYRESCVRIEESLDENHIELNFDENEEGEWT